MLGISGGSDMRRRDIIAGVTGALALPLAAQAQRGERVRRVGLLTGFSDDDTGARFMPAIIQEGLASLGWVEGRNLRMDISLRWPGP
jgi:hypothetical protein